MSQRLEIWFIVFILALFLVVFFYTFRAPISKVHLCADQLANMRITPNHHTSPDTTSQFDLQTENIRVDYDTRLDIKKPTNKAEDWERFRELESR